MKGPVVVIAPRHGLPTGPTAEAEVWRVPVSGAFPWHPVVRKMFGALLGLGVDLGVAVSVRFVVTAWLVLVTGVFFLVLDRSDGARLSSGMANLLDEADQNRVLTLLNDTKFELEELSRLIPSSNRPAQKVLERALSNVSSVVKEMYQREMPIS